MGAISVSTRGGKNPSPPSLPLPPPFKGRGGEGGGAEIVGAAPSAGLKVKVWVDQHGLVDFLRSPLGTVNQVTRRHCAVRLAFRPAPPPLMEGTFQRELALIYLSCSLTGVA